MKEKKKPAIKFPEYELPFESFIGGWFIPTDICDQLVDLFHSTKESDIHEGMVGNGKIDKYVKDSKDLAEYVVDNIIKKAVVQPIYCVSYVKLIKLIIVNF